MALFMGAIALVTIAISKLIEWLNKVPEDLEIKLRLADEATKGLEKFQNRRMRFLTDFRNAEKRNNQTRMEELNKMAKKEFDIDEERFKRINKTLKGWQAFFKEYLKEVQVTAYNEALIKLKAEKWVQLEMLKGQQEAIKRSVFSQLVESGKSEELARLYTEFFVRGRLTGLKALTLGVNGLAKKWNEVNKEMKQAKAEIQTLNKTAFKVTPQGKGLDLFGTFVPEKGTTTTTTKDKWKERMKIEMAAFEDVMKAVIKHKTYETKPDEWVKIKNRYVASLLIPEIDKEALKQSIDKVLEESSNIIKEAIANIKTPKYVQQGNFFDFLIPEDYTIEDTLQMYSEYVYNLASITDSISAIYDTKLDKIQSYYDAEAALIQNSLMSEEQKNLRLAELDKQRYEEQKKVFEQQKKWREATVYLDLASGLMGIYSRAVSLQAPPSPFNWIQAGLESTALIAQSIAQVNAIRSQQLNAPSTSSASSNTATPNIALNPSKTALTSKEERLNMIQKANKDNKTPVVKVSEINDVQDKVKVRDVNSVY